LGVSGLIGPRDSDLIGRPNQPALELLVWVAYSVVAVSFTYPLVLHLTDRLPGVGTDAYQLFWVAWWDGWSLLRPGLDTFHCPLVFYPDGAHLNGEPLPFGLAFGLLSLLLPTVLTFNLLYLFQYVFAAWGCYRLALYLWGRRDAAFVGGLIFGFSPYMLVRGTGHLSLMNTGFVPLAVLACLWLVDGGRFRLGRAVVAGVLLGLTGLSSAYFTVFLGIWLVGLTVFLARDASVVGGLVASGAEVSGWRRNRADGLSGDCSNPAGVVGVASLPRAVVDELDSSLDGRCLASQSGAISAGRR